MRTPPVSWRPFLVLVACMHMSSCDTTDAPGSTGPLPGPSSGGKEVSRAELSSARGAIEITNMDDVSRHYLLFEADLAAAVDPVLDPAGAENWISLAPGESIEVSLNNVAGWHADATAIVVYSWTNNVPRRVGEAVQWAGEGWYTMRVEL